ncbi:MAG: UDP-N-acetylmuramate dehydrogenase [Deltaproteobacteria bacterium]|nr:UDP-N-acetylmuramate dehydrogenase [Deltaproteobacteria bacterium]
MKPRHVHFIAIAGTGMGSLAGLLEARGIEVTGSDENVYPPMSTELERRGIPVAMGFRAENVLARRPDLVVIGNAVRPSNPEARAAIEAGIAYRSFPDALRELVMQDRHAVVVAGTHGKTTATSLVAFLLAQTGRDPSLLVGGIAANFGGSFRLGSGPHFVVEGDEYDTAFFDKTPKFLHYGARSLLLTSVEFDHADIYRDLDHVKAAFRALVAAMPADGTLVAATSHAGVRDVVDKAPCRLVPYRVGEAEGPGFAAQPVEVLPEGMRLRVSVDGREAGIGLLPMHGRHNAENAAGALAIVAQLGVPLADALRALPEFRGVKRRQEVRGEIGGITIIDDFAHHPTAVRETVAGLRARYPERRLISIFEPRTNTSRRRVFQADYARAFDGSDRVIVARVAEAPIYSATGEVTERFSADELVADLRARGLDALALDGPDAIVDHLATAARRGDVLLVMSNGAFGNIWEKLLARLAPATGPA